MAAEAPSGDESRCPLVSGFTLPVRNVQALAESAALTADTIERYIRPDIDSDAVLTEHSDQVPVIDLGRLFNPDSTDREAAKLRFACEEWGFFQLVNHSIQEEVIAGVKREIEKFFQLPLDTKKAYAQRPGEIQGYGQAFVVSDDQKLDWADMFYLVSQPPQSRDMRYWPNEPRTFRNSVEEYSSALMKVTSYIVTFIAKTIGVDPKLMVDNCVMQSMRMNYYPPCMSSPEKVLGLSPHSDGGFLTILLEVNSVEGLQIKRHGAWVPVKPHAKALLVNAGDFLEIMTNGKYKSIEHRVTINAHKERLSISAFHFPKYDAMVSPVLGTPEEKVLYKTVRIEEYYKLYMSNRLDGKKALDFTKDKSTHKNSACCGLFLDLIPDDIETNQMARADCVARIL